VSEYHGWIYVPPDTTHGLTKMMLKRQGHKQITISLAANINPISVGYMKNKICLVNEKVFSSRKDKISLIVIMSWFIMTFNMYLLACTKTTGVMSLTPYDTSTSAYSCLIVTVYCLVSVLLYSLEKKLGCLSYCTCVHKSSMVPCLSFLFIDCVWTTTLEWQRHYTKYATMPRTWAARP